MSTVKIKIHFGIPINLLVIYFSGSVGSRSPVNILRILILNSVNRAVGSREIGINNGAC